MKNAIVTMTILLFSPGIFVSFKNAEIRNLNPEISFDEIVYDFGNRPQNSAVEYNFKFKNSGSSELIISEVKKSCGCTSTYYTNTPVKPGGTGEVTAKYDSKRVGPFDRTLTVVSNDPNHPQVILRIKGTIEANSNGGTPLNTNHVTGEEK